MSCFAIAAGLAAIAVLLAGGAERAEAHPLGNFTINHYTRIDVSEAGIELYRVLDMAEIPALQERQKIDANNDGAVDAAESSAYAASKSGDLLNGMSLVVNGERADLATISSELTFPEGQGGLSLLRLSVVYTADLPDGWRDSAPIVAFADENYEDRIGWREVIVRAGPGVELGASDVPAVDVSAELTSYPQDSLSSPLDVRSANFSFRPGVGAALAQAHPKQTTAVRGNPDGALAGFSDLIAKDELSWGVMAIALAAAVGFGAIHALSPGHGKTVVAAYLIGSRGTAKHALLLGAVVTLTHTSSVYLLGVVTLYLSQYILPEDLYPWLGVASGGLILLMGLSLLAGRLRSSGLLSGGTSWVRSRARMGTARRPALTFASERGAMHVAMSSHESSHSRIGQHHDEHVDQEHADGDAHDHPHVHADESEAHRHGLGPVHSHTIPGQNGEPVTLRSLVGLGIFGGMIPCPSAIVVMLSAIALHRVAFGLVLIVAFSLGLAGVLVAIGFALVYARAISERLSIVGSVSERLGRGGIGGLAVRAFPIASAAAVSVAGMVILLRALLQQGTL
jgi:ABC-type nickel/cobalt efflux system permease component RcnA